MGVTLFNKKLNKVFNKNRIQDGAGDFPSLTSGTCLNFHISTPHFVAGYRR